jgi:gamma-aminobutyric acid receptor subunit rho
MYNIDAVQAMAFDGCYHDSGSDVDQTSFSLHSEEDFMRRRSTGSPSTESPQIMRRKSLRGNIGRIILENNHVIDTYSRILFPIVFIIFNLFYWGVYV